MQPTRALIIGAGIGGPVLSLWLQKLGFEVVLTEARSSIAATEGAFLGVAPNGMNVLDALGLLGPDGLPQGQPCSSFRFANHAGDVIGAIDRSRDRAAFRWPLTMVRRGDLHGFLARAARERGVAVQHGRRLVALDRSWPGKVIARFHDGSEEQADLLIGCDGLRSATRALALPDAPAPRFSGLIDAGGFAPGGVPGLEPGVNLMVFGQRAFFGAFTTEQGETWWFHNGPPGEEADLRTRLLALHRDDPPWIGELLARTPALLGPWPLHELGSLPRWCDGRVCLLGDAAHAMSPSAGQGASLAMEDAMVLAQCLRDIPDVPRAFQAFERLRRPRVDAIARVAARQSSTKAPSRASAWFRDRLLPFFLRMGARQQDEGYAFRIDWDRTVSARA